MPLTEEARLIGRCQAGDTEAFGVLVETYQKGVYNLCYRLTHNPEEARDLAQEAFLRAYRSLDRFDPGRPFGPWIYRIAANLCHDRRRRERPLVYVDGQVGDGWELELSVDQAGPEELVIEEEEHATISRAIARLPAVYRQVITLYHVNGLSYQEIVEATGWPLSIVKNRLFRARKTLREWLSQESEGKGTEEDGRDRATVSG